MKKKILVGWIIALVLISHGTHGQSAVNMSSKSFVVCNSTEGRPACASDTPDKSISLNPEFNSAVCPEVLCAWKCRMDPQCLEFNVHSKSLTCDLYYHQPMNYLSTTDCNHFQVVSINKYKVFSTLSNCQTHKNRADFSELVCKLVHSFFSFIR